MTKWKTSNHEIERTEKILLPNGTHFSEDARNVIRCWNSTDVAACPGSGKTTVLLAKLKLLADRMPLENGAGICVLSHTNVAVNEIKSRLSEYADRLLCYPNYIGTIQSFVDKFVTMPYLRDIIGRNVQVVDDIIYAQHMLSRMQNSKKYSALEYVVNKNYEVGGQFKDRLDQTRALYLRNDGALCVERQKRALAGADKKSTDQYKMLIYDLLKNEGIMRYHDTYLYAEVAINKLTETYTDLFSSRFQYVFVDEYQDCDDIQRRAIDTIFNATKCSVIKIGDPDQAIYNDTEKEMLDWKPKEGFLSIATSCRYSQEIADVISVLKNGKEKIETSVGVTGVKPVLIVFAPGKIDRVITEFINILEKHGLYDNKAVYKVIGAVRKEKVSGLTIGSYWTEFDSSQKKQNEYNYWTLIDEIITSLSEGKLYKVERIIRKLLCRVLHYAKIRNPSSGKEFTIFTIKKLLDERCQGIYRQWICDLSRLQTFGREKVDCLMRQNINEVIKVITSEAIDVFKCLPEYFLDKDFIQSNIQENEENVFVDSIRGRRIEFDTIHGVKGETHEATLYLETDRQGSSDLNRILPYYGVGKIGKSYLYDYSRKLAYVGMSRPKKVLCVAMQEKTYEKGKAIFADTWEIIDLRDRD